MRLSPSGAVVVGLALTAASASTPQAFPRSGMLLAEGHLDTGGLQGTWRSVSDLASGRFAVHNDLGAYRTADIFDGRTQWKVEPSGGSHPLDSAYARRASTTEGWLARMAWMRADFGGAARTPPEMVLEGGRSFRVLTATPAAGVPVRAE